MIYFLKAILCIFFVPFFSVKCNTNFQKKVCDFQKKSNYANSYDLTIIGSINFSKSLARFPIGIIDILKDDLKINFITAIEKNLNNISDNIIKIIEKDNLSDGKVALLTDVLWLKLPKFDEIHKKIPKKSLIKIAYSMIESTLIPKKWVEILNSEFDSVVVPDDFLIEIYKNSGVKIPIFVLPMGLYLEEFLKLPRKVKTYKPFVFGCSAVFWERKNIPLLIAAFIKTFGNNMDVKLRIHTNNQLGLENLKKLIINKNIRNIEIITAELSWESYIRLVSTFNCYILISKGEGFSITPREAIAAGIPCILTDNTGHKQICDIGFVYSIYCSILEPVYHCLFKEDCGYQFNCTIKDVSKALRCVYNNYDFYLEKASKGRLWVQQFLYKNLKEKYLNLIKPKKVIFGNENKIINEYLMTNSKKLYEKYLTLDNN